MAARESRVHQVRQDERSDPISKAFGGAGCLLKTCRDHNNHNARVPLTHRQVRREEHVVGCVPLAMLLNLEAISSAINNQSSNIDVREPDNYPSPLLISPNETRTIWSNLTHRGTNDDWQTGGPIRFEQAVMLCCRAIRLRYGIPTLL